MVVDYGMRYREYAPSFDSELARICGIQPGLYLRSRPRHFRGSSPLKS